jgi:hypothetical protein
LTSEEATRLCSAIEADVTPDCWAVTLFTFDEDHISPDEQTLGDCTWDWAMRTARIRVALKGRSNRDVATTLLHELLHLSTAELESVHTRTRTHLGYQASEVQNEAWRDAAERHVRALEVAMGGLVPVWLEKAGLTEEGA